MVRVLENLEPNRVFYHFEELTKIPRESGNEQAVAGHLAALAKKHGYQTIHDEHNNVIVNIPATPGYEGRKKIIMQAHIDMVCQKEEGVSFDFAKDPITIYVDGEFIRAKGTTLGADDGFGVAMLMAIMESGTIPHPPLQLIFTAGEEILFVGAQKLDGTLLDGEYFIGLDCSRDDIIMVSCAGISTNRMHVVCTRQPVANAEKKKRFAINIGGLRGGHSGNMIHLGRVNAIKLMGDVLLELAEKYSYELLSFTGDGLLNVIPQTASAAVCCDLSIAHAMEEEIARIAEKAKAAYRRTEPDIIFTCTRDELLSPSSCLDAASQKSLFALLTLIPSGANTIIDDAFTLAESSSNLGVLEEKDGEFIATVSIRSNKEYLHDVLQRKMALIADRIGGSYVVKNRARSWEFNPNSRLMAEVDRLYRELNGEAPEIKIIHASVEGAVFVDKMAQRGLSLDLVNVGCVNHDVHTPSERLSIASVGKTYSLLLKILEELE